MGRLFRLAAVLLFLTTAVFAQNVQRSEMSFNVHWYGAVPNDGIDDTAAFIAAVAAVPSYGRIYVPRGAYNLSSTVLVNKHRIHIEGDRPWATTIYFTPASNDVPVFDFNSSPAVNYQGSLRGMSFISQNNTLKKIAVRLTDGIRSNGATRSTGRRSWPSGRRTGRCRSRT